MPNNYKRPLFGDQKILIRKYNDKTRVSKKSKSPQILDWAFPYVK